MAKQNGGKPQIDEDFMKEIISQGLPVKKQETPMVANPITALSIRRPMTREKSRETRSNLPLWESQ